MSVCRFCLDLEPKKDITQLKLSKPFNSKSYTEIILFCIGTQVEEDSKVSTKLCLKCFDRTIEFYIFKAQALRSEAYLTAEANSQFKDGVSQDKIKTEIETMDVEDVTDNGFESDARFDDVEGEVKDEPKVEDGSEDELLSVIKKIKYEFIEEKGKENAPVKKRKARPRKIKTLKIKIPKSKQDLKAGSMKICEECGKYVRNLNTHRLTHLPLEQRKLIKCEICQKEFLSAQSKYKHKKRKHFGAKKECPICLKMVMNLSVHKKMHMPEEMKYECVSCGRRFVTKARLDMHVSIHTKDRPYECDICNAKFRLKLCMTLHKRRVHDREKSHLCQYCSKSFFKKHHLQIHLRSHTKEKPHPCTICSKMFSSSTTLKNHMLIHGGEKKHACTLCDMTFIRVGYLRAHMLSHTKEKRFPCQYCGVRFHRSDHRKRHEYTAHVKSTATPA